MRKYRSVIIGCGGRAIRHAKAYARTNRGQLTACCDLNLDKASALASQFSLRAYQDPAEMLKAEQPDLVHIVTQPTSRVELMELMDTCGIPACIVEKPIAWEVRDWNALVALEKNTKTKFAVCHQFRWHAALSRCRSAIESGKLGRLLFLDFTARHNLCDQGTHVLDYAMSLNRDSRVVRVYGTASGKAELNGPHPGPELTVAQVEFANGVRGHWSTGSISPKGPADDTPWKHVRVAAYGEKGRTLWEEFNRWEIVSPGEFEHGDAGDMSAWGSSNDAAQTSMIESMYDWIEDDQRPAGTNLNLGLHQWNVVLGLYASFVWGCPVSIPFDPPVDLYEQLSTTLRSI